MDENRIKMQHKFDDFAECTEYYYDELGKLEALKDNGKAISKKEAKKMHGYIMTSFFAAMDNLEAKAKANATVEKTEVKEFNKEFKAEHKTSVLQPLKTAMRVTLKPFKMVTKSVGKLLKLSKSPEPEVLQIEDAGLGVTSSPALSEGQKSQENSQNKYEDSGKKSDANE